MEYIRDQPHAWLDRQLVMDEVSAEVADYHRQQAAERARAGR